MAKIGNALTSLLPLNFFYLQEEQAKLQELAHAKRMHDLQAAIDALRPAAPIIDAAADEAIRSEREAIDAFAPEAPPEAQAAEPEADPQGHADGMETKKALTPAMAKALVKEAGGSISEAARRYGCSRQYMSKKRNQPRK